MLLDPRALYSVYIRTSQDRAGDALQRSRRFGCRRLCDRAWLTATEPGRRRGAQCRWAPTQVQGVPIRFPSTTMVPRGHRNARAPGNRREQLWAQNNDLGARNRAAGSRTRAHARGSLGRARRKRCDCKHRGHHGGNKAEVMPPAQIRPTRRHGGVVGEPASHSANGRSLIMMTARCVISSWR